VIIHQGPYTKGSHNSDVTSGSDMRHVEFRRNFLPLLERYGVDITLGGHSHTYERSKLLNGHYGYSTTYNSSTHDVDDGYGRMPGSGSLTNDCAYEKVTTGTNAGIGAIHCTAGSSSKSGSYAINHPVMKVNWNTAGSVYIEVNDNKLSWWYLEQNGDTTDYFQILKDTDYDSTHVLTDSTVTLTASWPEGPYLWSNGATTRSITTTLGVDSTFYVQNITGSTPCMIDSFRVDFPSLVRYPFTEIDTTGLTYVDSDGNSVIRAYDRTEADANGWYYYCNSQDPNSLLFAVRNSLSGGNTLPIDNVIDFVEVRKAGIYDRITTGTDSFRGVMPFDWNVGTISQPNGNMDIKFYFDPNDLAAFTAVMDSIDATNAALVSTREWFKANQGSNVSFLISDLSIDSVANSTDLTSLLVAAPNYTTGVGSTDGTPWVDAGNGKNYIQFNGLSSFSGGTLNQTLFDPAPVPVNWLAVRASWLGGNAELIWQTAQEQDNDYYAIERKTPTNQFVEIGRVDGNGNSGSINTYQFTDTEASSQDGEKITYRIKQVDFNGEFSYSDVVSLTKESINVVSIYPNPTKNLINISIDESILTNDLHAQVYDLDGKLLVKEHIVASGILSIDLSELASGQYIVVLNSKEKLYTYRLIKE
ncbi:MAG: T9SS type A sorting domain-containing protein, partial [Bacteroidia bacterium]|nr:T9SS type A sorting domain-containing protein [Bacteroidia bacterium]